MRVARRTAFKGFLTLSGAASFIVTLWIARNAARIEHFAGDHQIDGPQKFHHRTVRFRSPRWLAFRRSR